MICQQMPFRCFWSVLLFLIVATGTVLAQSGLDLTVFRKPGASETQMAHDRAECHEIAARQSGRLAAKPGESTETFSYEPPQSIQEHKQQKAQEKVDTWKQKTGYNRAVQACLEGRGYKLVEH